MSTKHFNLSIFFKAILVSIVLVSTAHATESVNLVNDSKGWKMQVNGQDTYIKGMVWGYSPRDTNYTYNLWGQGDAYVKKVLDYDFSRMKDAGVNVIRSFATIPPQWVTYIYETYGIMTAINPLMGRYGASIDGVWVEFTDYSDSRTRQILKEEVLETVRRYKDVPGVIMFALGNESNYGLSWKSFEIENLPVGEQNTAKAEYLYSLFGEVINEAKMIDSKNLYTIVNGDIQYLDLIAKYGKNWDLLGTNVYRGVSFTSLWAEVKAKYNKPVLMFEFGSDAFNAKDFVEDEVSQAFYLRAQWEEMYQKSYNNNQEGNSLGGFVFEWRDEWWKFKQTENLDIQDTNASWSNGGYQNDYQSGQNNMNEEWWGVNRLGDANSDGVFEAEPRLALDVLSQIWAINPYTNSTESIKLILDDLITQGRVDYAEALKNKKILTFDGGRVVIDALTRHNGEHEGEDIGAMAFFDFSLNPSNNFNAKTTLNLTQSAIQSNFKQRYGDRMHDDDENEQKHLEVYDFEATYKTPYGNFNGFYHVPRYHWGDEGDYFGILRETTDMDGQDIWNAKAPSGVEFEGTGTLDGLKILAGEEVYWGANPKAIIKYQFGNNKQYTILHSEDIQESSGDSQSSNDDTDKARVTTLQGEFELEDNIQLKVGGIISNTQKIDEPYFYYRNGKLYQDTIEFKDTLGLKARIDFDKFTSVKPYIGLRYGGLVADGGEHIAEKGTNLSYSGAGNKRELELGMDIPRGHMTFTPRILLRDNLEDAIPHTAATINGSAVTIGTSPRRVDRDPFAVTGNRAVRGIELFMTYDPTPGTYFYEWDNDDREDAGLAYNFGITYEKYPTITDANSSKLKNETDVYFLNKPAEQVWKLSSKIVRNYHSNLRSVYHVSIGKEQPNAEVNKAEISQSIVSKHIINKRNIFEATYKKNAWGEYDFQKEQDIRFPHQFALGYTRLLEVGKTESNSDKIGVNFYRRTLDPAGVNDDRDYSNMNEIHFFLELRF